MLLPTGRISSSIRWAQDKAWFDMSFLKKYGNPFSDKEERHFEKYFFKIIG